MTELEQLERMTKEYKTLEVDISEYFTFPDGATKKKFVVIVRPFPPFTKAKLAEMRTAMVRTHADKSTTFSLDADTTLKMNKMKLGLGIGVESHTITINDNKLDWDEKLFDSLNKKNPKILDKVIKAIDEVNTDDENPTSEPENSEKIEAGVEAIFSKIENPVFRIGSLKWLGLKRWGFYISMFMAITDTNGYSLHMTPAEYREFYNREPRLMEILLCIQRAVRKKTHENIEESRGNKSKSVKGYKAYKYR